MRLNFDTATAFFNGWINKEPQAPKRAAKPADDAQRSRIYASPAAYKTMHSIKPYATSKDEDGNITIHSLNLTISNETVKEFLLKPSGEPDDKAVLGFIKLFNVNLSEIRRREDENLLLLEEQAWDETDFAEAYDTYENKVKPHNALKGAAYGYGGEQRLDFMRECMGSLSREGMFQEAYNLTELLFALSKTKDGYDFSNMDKKMQFAKIFNSISRSYDRDVNNGEDVYSKTLLELLKNEDGVIDTDFALEMAKIVRKADTAIDLASLINPLKKYYNSRYDGI